MKTAALLGGILFFCTGGCPERQSLSFELSPSKATKTASSPPAPREDKPVTRAISHHVLCAVECEAEEFVAASSALRSSPPEELGHACATLNHTDPVAPTVCAVMRALQGDLGPRFDAALQLFHDLEASVVATPIPSPSPVGALKRLVREFPPEVALPLVLWLVKHPSWRGWRSQTILGYAVEKPDPRMTPLMIRLLGFLPARQQDERLIGIYLDREDPSRVRDMCAAEVAHLQSLHRPIHTRISALADGP